ncbi:dihydrofolate reductase family protein [Enteractinococcus coprophilus]|uniref:dihydrofolate reductase family protein n=1 Tax=Enteractinococcus coprophilus TaxID=1027633 RepID=UPI001150D319|nr:dihydrofolate reductase family protein [Enteractinococcus coprophilus]
MDYESSLMENAGTLLLGRITHGDFASYWPAVAADETQAGEGTKRYAHRLDQMDKFVVSRSGAVAFWPGTHRVEDATAIEIQRIKDRSAGDVIVYGSLSLIGALNVLNLIDEFDFIVPPTLLCRGKPILNADQRPRWSSRSATRFLVEASCSGMQHLAPSNPVGNHEGRPGCPSRPSWL